MIVGVALGKLEVLDRRPEVLQELHLLEDGRIRWGLPPVDALAWLYLPSLRPLSPGTLSATRFFNACFSSALLSFAGAPSVGAVVGMEMMVGRFFGLPGPWPSSLLCCLATSFCCSCLIAAAAAAVRR